MVDEHYALYQSASVEMLPGLPADSTSSSAHCIFLLPPFPAEVRRMT